MQHLEISRAWGGPDPILLVTDFQWLGTASVIVGTPKEGWNRSAGTSPSLVTHHSPPYPLDRGTYRFTCIFCRAQRVSCLLSLPPSLVAYCLVWGPLHPLLHKNVLCSHMITVQVCCAFANSQEVTPLPHMVSSMWFCLWCSAGSSEGPVTMMAVCWIFFFSLNIHYTIICR